MFGRVVAIAFVGACVGACVLPTAADPLREVQYAVVATADGIPHRTLVRVDFVGGSANSAMRVAVDENDGASEVPQPSVAIEHSGRVAIGDTEGLTDAEEAICYFMALESEDLTGVDRGDTWERSGPVPGGHQTTHFQVTNVGADGYVELALSRHITRHDGSIAVWNGEMIYDAHAVVPTSIALRGRITTADGNEHDMTLAIKLAADTFDHR